MKRPAIAENSHIHMIGITGAGMSGLAIVMAQLGYKITGSDRLPGPVADKLRGMGVTVHTGHDASYVDGADLVVATAAVNDDNPEIAAAQAKGIPTISRAEMLGQLMAGNFGIGVAGTHGKTTTTSMLALVLAAAEIDATVLIGGDLAILKGNAKLGSSDIFLAESCEAFSSFLTLAPKIAVVTNIEADHLDWHGSLEGVKKSFVDFLSQVQENGSAIVCVDCPNVRSVIPSIGCRVVTFGVAEDADCVGYDVDVSTPEPTFKVRLSGREFGEFKLSVPGIHNVRNALSAIVVGMELGIAPDRIREGLLEFHGAGRRFDILGMAKDIMVVDDYAHHPTEIRATIEAAQSYGRRIVAVFQPHLFSRTLLMAEDFAKSLELADAVFLTDIYPAREEPIEGVTSALIINRINADAKSTARLVGDKNKLPDELLSVLKPGDMLIVMGAGDVRSVAEAVWKGIESSVK